MRARQGSSRSCASRSLLRIVPEKVTGSLSFVPALAAQRSAQLLRRSSRRSRAHSRARVRTSTSVRRYGRSTPNSWLAL
eukprot:13435433-Alexandrium_andersonii.AAC.1